MKQPLFPLSAFKYDKKIVEIREVVRVEMSAIILWVLESALDLRLANTFFIPNYPDTIRTPSFTKITHKLHFS